VYENTAFRITENVIYKIKMAKLYREDLEELALQYFDKKFYFCPQSHYWALPEPTEIYVGSGWKDDGLQKLKDELKNVMSKLDRYSLEDWQAHTRAMNKAGDIQHKLCEELDPELMTEDWCKFCENVTSFNLIRPAIVLTGCLNSVHLCEASGSFITSLNHYMKVQNSGIDWNWLATTLNPCRDGNPSSCKTSIYRFIMKTLDHWNFGLDNTGNLMDVNNMLDIMKEASEMGDVFLVTANGSMECPENSGEQESVSSSLHYCEAVSAMHILAKGGSLLLKMFTMYEHESICLMYLLCCAFTSVRVFKPVTSNEGDSEVYVVCLDYRGRDFMEPWLEVLRKHYGPNLLHRAMFPRESIPQDFLDQFYECTTTFHNTQTEAIETNMRLYERGTTPDDDLKIKEVKNMIANHFLEIYEINKLSQSEKVTTKTGEK
jgi:cap2 methyltransferase